MAIDQANRWVSTGNADDHPLAVPDLAIAAQLLGRSLPTVENAAKKVEPYMAGDGTPRWSLRELAIALGLVESPDSRVAQRRGRAPERSAS